MTESVAQRFLPVRHIALGGFGSVFLGKDLTTNDDVIIKFELTQGSPLAHEARVYRKLNRLALSGFPRMYYDGNNSLNKKVIVLERLGFSLEHIQRNESPQFSIRSIAKIGIQAISLLERLHDAGYVHCDVHPGNLLTGKSDQDELFLIDFGSASKYLNGNGRHVPANRRTNAQATLQYGALGFHLGRHPERMWDLQSLAYVFRALRSGRLPWSHAQSPQDFTELKRQTTPAALFRNMPQQFTTFLMYCQSRPYGHRPNYSYLRQLLNQTLTSHHAR